MQARGKIDVSQNHGRLRIPSIPRTGSRLVPTSQSRVRPPVTAGRQTSKEEPKKEVPHTIQQFDVSIELVQLHHLHRSSPQVQRQWEASAKEFYRKKHSHAATRHANLKTRKREFRAQGNAAALIRWCKGTVSNRATGDLIMLSKITTDVEANLGPEGHYARVINGFTEWYSKAVLITEARSKSIGAQQGVIAGIGDGWRAEATTLAARYNGALTQLSVMGDTHANYDTSEMARLLEVLSSILVNSLHELEEVQSIERLLVRQEATWVHGSLERIDADVSNQIMTSFA
ncbi:hypothetical protein MMC25_002816 [Agyrium rufum]|nr:hypothetical protein [Agyrium rufum]